MTIRTIICFGLISIITGSCNRTQCNRSKLPKYQFPTEMEDYFQLFRIDNFWVYENNSKTKSDSIFINFFFESFDENCQSKSVTFLREFNIASSQNVFRTGEDCKFYYSTGKKGAMIQGGRGDLMFDFMHIDGNLSFSVGGTVPKHSLVFQNTTFDNAILYTNKENGTRLHFIPNIGIVLIETATDTFNLKKHLIR